MIEEGFPPNSIHLIVKNLKRRVRRKAWSERNETKTKTKKEVL
jgi:hypothetical protein